jgi:hypothetical protein
MGLGDALLSDPRVTQPPGHARGGYRSSGSAWLQMTVFVNQVADYIGGYRMVVAASGYLARSRFKNVSHLTADDERSELCSGALQALADIV